jgi:hypothetical protein
MSDTFEINNFSVITSLSEKNIYIKFLDNINFIIYDSNVDQQVLYLNFALPEIYQIIMKCFKKEPNFTINVIHESNILRLLFTAVIGGMLTISFEIQLNEKIMSNDAQLTVYFNKLEYKCNILSQKIDDLTINIEKCKEENKLISNILSHSEIFLGDSTIKGIVNIPINSTEIVIDKQTIYWDKLSRLYCLKKIQFVNVNVFFKEFSIPSLEEIEIIGNETIDISGIQKNTNLKKITLNGVSNLVHTNFITNIKECSNLKHLIIKSCEQINSSDIYIYCQLNQIELDIS